MGEPTIAELIKALPDGYSRVLYQQAPYGLTIKRRHDGKSVKLYAEALQGNDVISVNIYSCALHDYVRPCEMSGDKVHQFLLNVE